MPYAYLTAGEMDPKSGISRLSPGLGLAFVAENQPVIGRQQFLPYPGPDGTGPKPGLSVHQY